MENVISVVSDFCGILGFIISLFAINGVRKINKKINDNSINQTAKGSGNSQNITTN